jgi:hypothetical protein
MPAKTAALGGRFFVAVGVFRKFFPCAAAQGHKHILMSFCACLSPVN